MGRNNVFCKKIISSVLAAAMIMSNGPITKSFADENYENLNNIAIASNEYKIGIGTAYYVDSVPRLLSLPFTLST